MAKRNKKIYQIKIELAGIEPPLWRRLLIPDYATFEELHLAIQRCMGWEGYGLHQFIMKAKSPDGYDEIVIGNYLDLEDETVVPEDETRLHHIFSSRMKDGLYLYDFEAEWKFSLFLEKEHLLVKGRSSPVCIAGERSAPLEDEGGLTGYNEPDFPESDTFYPENLSFPDMTADGYELFDWENEEGFEFDDEDDDEDWPDDEDEEEDSECAEKELSAQLVRPESGKSRAEFLGLSFKQMFRLFNSKLVDLSDLVEFHFNRLNPADILKAPIIREFTAIIKLYEQNSNRIALTQSGYYRTESVGTFLRTLYPEYKEHTRMKEKDVPRLLMLHTFLITEDLVCEERGWSSLRDLSRWSPISNENLLILYKDLFQTLLKSYAWTELLGMKQLVGGGYEFIQDSALFSLLLLHKEAGLFRRPEELFQCFVQAFPDFAPDWKSLYEDFEKGNEVVSGNLLIYTRLFLREFAASLYLVEQKELSPEKAKQKGENPLWVFRKTELFTDLIEWKL